MFDGGGVQRIRLPSLPYCMFSDQPPRRAMHVVHILGISSHPFCCGLAICPEHVMVVVRLMIASEA